MENLVSPMVSLRMPSMMQGCLVGSRWRRLRFTVLTYFCSFHSFQEGLEIFTCYTTRFSVSVYSLFAYHLSIPG